MEIRKAKIKDLDKVVELENKVWTKGTRANKNKFESRFKIFSKGFFLAFDNDILIGSSTSEIINYNPKNPPISWETITDNGYIRNHNPKGNALYVVSIGAISRSGGGSALIDAQKNLTKRLNLRYLVLGARISEYDKYCKENEKINIQNYVKLKREDGELLDSELRFYTRNGLNLHKIIPNYMEDDKESRNYGAIMVWKNG